MNRLFMFIVAMLAIAVLSLGCMGKYEYKLRSDNAKNQSEWQPTYEPITITGPITISDGASITASAPSQPFVPLSVPDGMGAQQRVFRDAVTGALIIYGINQAGGSKTVKNSHNTGVAP